MRKPNRRDGALAVRSDGRIGGLISRYPREFVGIIMATAAVTAIFVNALYLQKGPHPAPIFKPRVLADQETPNTPRAAPLPLPPDAAQQSRGQIIAAIQRELNRRGFYDGIIDGLWGAKTDIAAREFVQAAGLSVTVEASDDLLRAIVASRLKARPAAEPARRDAIANLIVPSKRILAVQTVLADFGYGQIKPTGVFNAETRSAIEKFERDRRLPVTGDISDGVVRELAAMSGRPIE